MTKDPNDNVIRFPTESVAKFGLERVKTRRKKGLEDHGQLSLFRKPAGEVLKIRTGIGAFDEALLLDERGDADAREHYRRAIEKGDSVSDAYCNLGVMESRAGRTTAAFDCFKEALKYEPRHFESHYNLGNLYFEAEELRPAQLHYEVAAELDDEFPNVYFNLGLVNALIGDFEAAIQSLTDYKELVPESEHAKANELLANIRLSISKS